MKPIARPHHRLLRQGLSGALGRRLALSDLPANDAEWRRVLRFSGAHLVTPCLYWAFHEQGLFAHLPGDVAEYLDAVHTLNLDRNRNIADQLVHLIQTLNSIGVQPLLLKGVAAFAAGLYPTLGERMVRDIDILIPAPCLPDILSVLATVGYQPMNSGCEPPDPVAFTGCHHYPPVISAIWPVRVELHVHPVSLEYMKLLSSEDVFRDATSLLWHGGECLLPSPTHFIVHNIIHASLMDSMGRLDNISLRQLFECVHASRTYSERIDWSLVKRSFDSHGYRHALREYLLFAHSCFGFDMPSAINIGGRDRLQVKLHQVRLDLSHPAIEWPLALMWQLSRRAPRARNLRNSPGALRKLATLGFYSRLWMGTQEIVRFNTFRE